MCRLNLPLHILKTQQQQQQHIFHVSVWHRRHAAVPSVKHARRLNPDQECVVPWVNRAADRSGWRRLKGRFCVCGAAAVGPQWLSVQFRAALICLVSTQRFVSVGSSTWVSLKSSGTTAFMRWQPLFSTARIEIEI